MLVSPNMHMQQIGWLLGGIGGNEDHLILNPKGVTADRLSIIGNTYGCVCVCVHSHRVHSHRHTLSMTEGASENQAAAYGLS